MPHLHGKGITQQPCGKCKEGCAEWDQIFCDICACWFHVKCEQLEIQHQEVFKDLPEAPYICRDCRSDEKGGFNFKKSLERLHKGAKQGYNKLFSYVEREKQFLKEDMSFTCVRNPKYSSDVQAQALLQEYCSSEKKSAAKITKDNNSLFSAVSVALVGNEKLSTELRVRCCIEMVAYDSFYRYQTHSAKLSQCAPEYTESCLNCATPDEDSCIWTVSALASVTRRRIQSIYPPVNGKMDQGVKILNTTFVPRSKTDDDDECLKIFWSSSKKTGLTPGSWVPDTFVPLVEMPVIPLSPMVLSPYLTPSRVSGRVRKPTAKVMAITSPKLKNQMKLVVENSMSAGEDDSDNDPDFEMPVDFKLEPTDEDDSFVMKHQSANIDLEWMDKYTHVAAGGKPLRGTSFLAAQEVFNELTSATEICETIPTGRKEDVFFVVDNSRNLRYKNRRNYFHDDCGRYNQKSGTTCKSFYLLTPDNILQQLIKDKGKYCKESKRISVVGASPPRGRGRPQARGRGRRSGGVNERKVTKWIPMDPQPDENKVITLHRYYSCLDIDPSYKRRICWFSNLPDTVERGHSVFLVEYITKPVAGIMLPLSRKTGHTVTLADSQTSDVDDGTGALIQGTDANDSKRDMDEVLECQDADEAKSGVVENEEMESQNAGENDGGDTGETGIQLTDYTASVEMEDMATQATETEQSTET